MSRKQHRPSRLCKNCGAPSNRQALCAACSPHKLTNGHQDKYVQLAHLGASEKTIAQLEQEILARKKARR